MSYVPRRIQIARPNGETEILSEDEFASLDAPLILLGEPGAGKTKTAKALAAMPGKAYFTADLLATGSPASNLPEYNPVIDGLDETPGDGSGSPLLSILRRLEEKKTSTFILTCRAADWADIQNERMVQNWFGKKPIVGHLQPLNDAEIVAVVDAVGSYAAGGQTFLQQAETRNVTDLARNPQALILLLAAIAEGGWPRSKTELYQRACESFATEKNEIHQSLNPKRPSVDDILSVTGFICAQLLLSGKRGVNVDGRDQKLFTRIGDLTSDAVGFPDIEAAASSLLFVSSAPGNVEPYHRTIAEYLAARWFSDRLRDGTLSIRRLETLFYKGGNVPVSLRGVHAWLATLERDVTERLVEHDPYGCFRYGDVQQYSVEQARDLLKQLQNLAAMDPYFRSEDWEGQVGGGLARPELRDEIVELMGNPDVPYQLTTVILESLKGTEFVATIRDELRNVVLSENTPYVVRDRALTALETDSLSEDWHDLALKLIASAEHGSARMAVEIAIDHPQLFEGAEIAAITNAYDEVNEKLSQNLHLGIAYRLLPRMSPEQLASAIPIYSGKLPHERYDRSKLDRKAEERLLDALKVYIEKGGQPSAQELWEWLRHVTRYQYRAQDWPAFSLQYFSQRTDIRRQIQTLALDTENAAERRMTSFYLSEMGAGLTFQESDIAFHLEDLAKRASQLNDFIERWRNLVEWIFLNQSFIGQAEAVARQQAESRPELQTILDEITNRPPPSWEREQEQRQRRWETKQKRQNSARYRSFATIKEEVREGRHLSALYDVATAYMGLFTDVNSIDDPIRRVEWMVGSENVEAALQGIAAACLRNDLPTPRAIATLEAEEKQRYFLEKIALVGCALRQSQGGDVASLPRETLICALAACQWGLYSQEKYLPGLEETLTRLVFSETAEMKSFVKDTIEPLLFRGNAHVSGLNEVLSAERFTALASELGIEWLARSGEMSDQSLRHILKAALNLSDRAALSDLVAMKLQANVWPTPDHRDLWCAVAFLVDFQRFGQTIRTLATTEVDTLSAIRLMLSGETKTLASQISVSQLSFLIETYAFRFPLVGMPQSGWGENTPYESARFLAACIAGLGEIVTEEAQSELERLVASGKLGNHIDNMRHVLAEHTRAMAEADWSNHTLKDVRHILLGRAPQTIEDLQALVADQLHAMQDRLQNGSFNAVRPFWDNTVPHRENYCRDLIATHIEPHLEKLGIRVHTEGTMPSDTRCDLLCTIGAIDLPIEIKGQWHGEIWTAASVQLEGNYSRHYRANGRGIYLVIWFGDVPGMNPPGIRENGRPESATAMLKAIPERSPTKISEKTTLFVLDVSKSLNDQRKDGGR
ncbi:NACHT domain-containing NTPase [Neorhizobium sp. T7_12]|uniref:NACHT domain-containing protein n=1 Tax=Neorhizobium sp. T7_12 TaxID=2093832 RepID=UPI000CFA4687|nr:hypothetical protein [Neorhizobium sp. T7_12]